MPKYNAVLMREIAVEIEAADMANAERLAKAIVGEFPENTCIIKSITVEGYVAPEQSDPFKLPDPDKPKPFNRPPGGSPGTPTLNLQPEPVLEVIAKAA